MNEWNPDQIEQGFDQLEQLTTLMKSPQWSEMTQEERNAFVKFGAELEGKLTNMMQIHQSSDDKQVDMDDYISAQDEMEYNELVNKLKKSEASKPFKGNEDKVKAAHDKYGADIDKVKLSDDPICSI